MEFLANLTKKLTPYKAVLVRHLRDFCFVMLICIVKKIYIRLPKFIFCICEGASPLSGAYILSRKSLTLNIAS